jgi:hypothetical protein
MQGSFRNPEVIPFAACCERFICPGLQKRVSDMFPGSQLVRPAGRARSCQSWSRRASAIDVVIRLHRADRVDLAAGGSGARDELFGGDSSRSRRRHGDDPHGGVSGFRAPVYPSGRGRLGRDHPARSQAGAGRSRERQLGPPPSVSRSGDVPVTARQVPDRRDACPTEAIAWHYRIDARAPSRSRSARRAHALGPCHFVCSSITP